MGWIGCVLYENSDATSWHELLHQFSPFWTECCNATNYPKCTQIVWNTPKHEVRVQKGGSGAFVAKNSDTTSWYKLLHHFGPFCTEFCMGTKRSQIFVWQPNGPKCSQIVQKHNKTWVYSPMGWIGCVRCEKFRRDIVALTFAPVWPVLNWVL